MMYIRKDARIYKRNDLGSFDLFEEYKSKNAAKRHNRKKLNGAARKYRPEFQHHFTDAQA